MSESCQTPHITHHWKEDGVSDDNDNDKAADKDKYKDGYKYKDKDKMLKNPTHAIFSKKITGTSRISNMTLYSGHQNKQIHQNY